MADTFALDAEPCRLCDVPGFRTGAAACGLKPEGPDVGILLCEAADGVGTAIFTGNPVRAAPVLVSSPRAASGRLRAAVVNAGNANSCTGKDGRRDAQEMIALAASGLDVPQELVLVASSGCAGRPLPMEQVRKGIEGACRDARESGGGDFAGAVAAPGVACRLTSASGTIDGKPFRIAGMATGAGASDMAMMFAFLVTDAAIDAECLREIAISAVDRTFANLVEGGKSTNDTFCVLSSSLAGNEIIDNVFSAGVLSEALEAVAKELVVGAAAGKGPRREAVEVRVSSGPSPQGATAAAREIARSIQMTGLGTPEHSTGLVLAAAGRSGKGVEAARATVRLAGETVYERGRLVHPLPEGLEKKLQGPSVTVEVDLGLGSDSAVAWTHGAAAAGKEQVEAAENAAEEAKAAAESLAARLRDAETERESLHGKVKEEESAHKAAKHETQVIRKRLEATEKEKEDASAAVQEARAAAELTRKEIESKLEESESARTTAEGDAEKLRKELALAKETAEKAAAERESLQAKVKESSSAQAASAKEAEEVRRGLEQACEEARTLAQSGREEVDAKVKEAEAAEAERKALEEKLGKLEQKVEEADSARATAAGEAGKFRKQLKKAGDKAEAGRTELDAKLKEAESALKQKVERLEAAQRAAEQARASTAAEREDIETKLKEAGSARDSALRETEQMRGRLELAERPVDKKAAKRAAKEAKTEIKELKAKLKRVAMVEKELESLEAELERKDAEVAELRAAPGRAEAPSAEVERYRDEAEKAMAQLEAVKSEAEQVKAQFSLKEQLLKQLMAEEPVYRKLAEDHKRLLAEFKELQKKAQDDA